jgi:hypothetical protein
MSPRCCVCKVQRPRITSSLDGVMRRSPRQQTVIMAAAALPALPELGGLLDAAVVSAAAAASFKLLLLCGTVALLSARGMIPVTAAPVMSKVAFALLIPSMLLTSTARTLAGGAPPGLAVLPLFAVAQITLGAVLGAAAADAVLGRSRVARAALGWRELHPTPAAAAIAASTAAALRTPAVGT